MHNASARGFAVRRPGDSPITTQNFTPSNKLKNADLSNAKDAVLHKGSERVLVRDIVREADGQFSAEIYGFEPSYQLDFEGMKVGERIVFRDEHVFSCGV